MVSKYVGYKKDFLIEELRRFYKEYGEIPTQNGIDKIKQYPSRKTFTNHFPSFDDALRAAGFDIPFKKEFTKESLINEIHRFIKEFGKRPYSRDMDSTPGFPCKKHFSNIFGSWNNAIKAAGLKERVGRYTDEELKEKFLSFVAINGRVPKIHDFNNSDYPSFWCYQNRFGSWNKALVHYGFDPTVGNSGSHHLFENGELCKSLYEFDVSNWLRKNKISYLRNAPYSEWIYEYDGRKDCDYIILHNGEIIWLEVAGLYPSRKKISSMEKDYKKRFDHKLSTLINNFNYKILYPQDFREKTLDEMFSFLFEIKRPEWLTCEEIYSGIGEEFEVRK